MQHQTEIEATRCINRTMVPVGLEPTTLRL